MRKRYGVISVGLLAATVLAAFMLPAQGKAKAVTIFMSALEYKGGTTVDKEAWPPAEEPGTLALDPLGGGYGLKEPDDTGRWEVNSYRFEPGFLSIEKGTKVTLEIAGINGSHHDVSLLTPSGDVLKSAVITRGRLTRVVFRPKSTGMWTLVCATHPPNMTASILVTD